MQRLGQSLWNTYAPQLLTAKAAGEVQGASGGLLRGLIICAAEDALLQAALGAGAACGRGDTGSAVISGEQDGFVRETLFPPTHALRNGVRPWTLR